MESFFDHIKRISTCSICNLSIDMPFLGSNCSHIICSYCYDGMSHRITRKRKNDKRCSKCKNSEFKYHDYVGEIFNLLRTILEIRDNATKSEGGLDVSHKENPEAVNLIKIDSSLSCDEKVEKNTVEHPNSSHPVISEDAQRSAVSMSSRSEPVMNCMNNRFLFPAPPAAIISENLLSCLKAKKSSELSLNEKYTLLQDIFQGMNINDIVTGLVKCLADTDLPELIQELRRQVVGNDICINETVVEKLSNTPNVALEEKENIMITGKNTPSNNLCLSNHAKLKLSQRMGFKASSDPSKVIITCSMLPNSIKEEVEKFCDIFGITLTNIINENCTHLIVFTDNLFYISNDNYTYKYMFALSAKIYIVSQLWISSCLAQVKILNEEYFEGKSHPKWGNVDAPTLSRTTFNYLFENTLVILLSDFKNFMLSEKQILSILNAGKARVESSVENIDADLSIFKKIIVLGSNMREEKELRSSGKFGTMNVKFISLTNFLDCILYYSLDHQ